APPGGGQDLLAVGQRRVVVAGEGDQVGGGDAVERGLQRGAVGQVARDDLRAFRQAGAGGVAGEGAHPVAGGQQLLHERTADVARGTRDENGHEGLLSTRSPHRRKHCGRIPTAIGQNPGAGCQRLMTVPWSSVQTQPRPDLLSYGSAVLPPSSRAFSTAASRS